MTRTASPHAFFSSVFAPYSAAPPFALSASFTVEAALLMPSVLLVLLTVLFLCAHVHNRAVLVSSSCETAVSGRASDGNVLFLERESRKEMTDDRRRRSVSWHLTMVPLLWPSRFEEDGEVSYDKTDLPRFLHFAAAGKELYDDFAS